MEKITLAVIEPTHNTYGRNRITVLLEGGQEEVVGHYFTDELKFTEKEFIGLTYSEAIDLLTKRDLAYLRS
tara:strand:+ start:473 stop:685 length:213 start_codon:yes stop_codon:yes gene_type:complete